jgi:hypothetical protein
VCCWGSSEHRVLSLQRKDPVCTGENKTGTMWRGTAAARPLLKS